MVDCFMPFGGDVQLDQYGGIQEAVGWDETEQQISRDLYTCPQGYNSRGDYLQPDCELDPDYGIGLPRVEGQLGTQILIDNLRTKCMQAVSQNANVLSSPAPTVTFTLEQHVLSVYILVYLANNTPGNIVFPPTGSISFEVTP